ncbi:MAG TPA: hypothetical protein VGL77_18155 [Armatimonadota bacterium]|jgi:hypothetical protein
MMNKKQAREAIILAVLLLALLIAVVIQFTGGKKTSTSAGNSSAPNTAAADNAATTPSAQKDGQTVKNADLSWVTVARLDGLSSAVARGRDPFTDTLTPPPSPPHVPPSPVPVVDNKTVRPTSNGGLLPGALSGTLQGGIPRVVVPPLPIAPPAFILWGVAISSQERFATLSVGERFFTLAEGEMVPGVGWTVKRIIPDYNAVVLAKKGAQSVTIRLSGGTPK